MESWFQVIVIVLVPIVIVMPKEVSGLCNGRVRPIPKANKGIGKRVSQVVLKISGKFIQPGSGN